jgi:hypothetical protein
MRTARLRVTLALYATAAPGCGSSVAHTPSDLSPAHPASVAPTVKDTTATTTDFGIIAEYVGPIPHGETDGATGISLSVPPAGATPTLSWQQAVTLCFAGAGSCNRSAGTIRVSLAVGYDPRSGDELPDGAIKPIMNHDLVYVLAQPLGPCVPAGPAGESTQPSTYPSCTCLSFVDAHTGNGSIAVSGPSIRDPTTT